MPITTEVIYKAQCDICDTRFRSWELPGGGESNAGVFANTRSELIDVLQTEGWVEDESGDAVVCKQCRHNATLNQMSLEAFARQAGTL